MFEDINLPLILIAAFVSTASPGPATLAIAGASMSAGRPYGLALAAGVTTGSWTWSIAAALGLGAVMLANVWLFEMLRYFGACYLLFLAYKSARSAFARSEIANRHIAIASLQSAYGKGLALHLANPKAILFFGSLFAIGVPADASVFSLAIVIAAVGIQSLLVFLGYALLFSDPKMIARYEKTRRWIEAVFAIAFGAAGLRILTAKLEP
ncbi:threonine efflux protein, putative [hydrothermal vent metagenome]|uniref:Threonine efflux protein, putative n=1 Tax=hydrothermal vent metagenome TaxID=652676 RepID=A0A3B0RC15_9ZZZZ